MTSRLRRSQSFGSKPDDSGALEGGRDTTNEENQNGSHTLAPPPSAAGVAKMPDRIVREEGPPPTEMEREKEKEKSNNKLKKKKGVALELVATLTGYEGKGEDGGNQRSHKRGNSLSEGMSRLLFGLRHGPSASTGGEENNHHHNHNHNHNHNHKNLSSSQVTEKENQTGSKAKAKKTKRGRSQSSKEERTKGKELVSKKKAGGSKSTAASDTDEEESKSRHPHHNIPLPPAQPSHHQVRAALGVPQLSPQRPAPMRALASTDLADRWHVRRGTDREAGDPSLQLPAGVHPTNGPGGTVTPPALSPRERKEFIGRARNLTSPQVPTVLPHSFPSSPLPTNAPSPSPPSPISTRSSTSPPSVLSGVSSSLPPEHSSQLEGHRLKLHLGRGPQQLSFDVVPGDSDEVDAGPVQHDTEHRGAGTKEGGEESDNPGETERPRTNQPSDVHPREDKEAVSEEANHKEEKEKEQEKGKEKETEQVAGRPGAERLQLTKRTVQDFEFGKVLGEGSYGQVRAARDIATGLVLAIKILDKRHVVKEKKVEQVKREKQILEPLSHPNIVHLYCTFQDINSLFFVMEYCPNGELHRHLKRLGSFNFECTKFYIAELVSALEYLHSQGIMHRDIKPENMLLDANFHLKLIDFGTAKSVGPEQYARSTSFVGTAEYVPPELLNEHYSVKSSDLWALSCVLYQFLAGRSPFRGANDYNTFRKIKEMKLTDLVQKLLVPDWTRRLDYAHLKSHPFFEGIDWATLHTTTPPALAAPLVPIFVDEEKEKKLKAQEAKSSVWGKFLFKNSDEVIVQTDPVAKISKHFFGATKSPKKRQLILTDFPRLFYVDIDKMAQLGEIEWRPDLHVEARNDSIFEITSGEKTYVFEAEGHAAKWCKAIGRLQRRANGEDDFPEEEWTQGSLEASVSEGHVEIVEDVGDEREGEAREKDNGKRINRSDKWKEGSDSGSEGSSGRSNISRVHREEKRRSRKGKKDKETNNTDGEPHRDH